MTFFGIPGPWYTVGWKTAVTIGRQFGCPALVRCMADPHRLLEMSDSAAAAYNRTHADSLAEWSPALVVSPRH